MKILIICPSFPYPPDTGGAIRIFNLIKCLSKENEIDLIAVEHGEIAQNAVLEMKKYCKSVYLVPWTRQPLLLQIPKVISRIFKGEPFVNKYTEFDAMSKSIYSVTKHSTYDIIQFEHTFTGGNIKYLNPKHNAKTVLSLHNVCYLQYYRFYKVEKGLLNKIKGLLNWLPMFSWEPKIASAFDKTIVVSEIDKILLNVLGQELDISVIPNGVDTREFCPCPSDVKNKNILIVGTLNYKPNADAVQYFFHEIFPLIRRKIPDCTLTIIGKSPDEEIQKLGSSPGVTVMANVDDVRPYYREALLSAVALRSGGGTRLKIIESMALGTPVVSTSIGCEGLDVTDRQNILIANDAQEFADKVCELCISPSLRELISSNARKLAEDKYDWELIAHNLQDVYNEIVSHD